MLNVICPEIDWDVIACVGWDLDGTIYDEFEFISQVYRVIVEEYAEVQEEVLVFMLNRWLEKGSSYPYIFQEAQKLFRLDGNFERDALHAFRNYKPRLMISARIKHFLEILKKENKYTFLVTDGTRKLQNNKIDGLNIREYFDMIIIAESHQKPDPYYGTLILRNRACTSKEIVYIGDRDVDENFANSCGFQFLRWINRIGEI